MELLIFAVQQREGLSDSVAGTPYDVVRNEIGGLASAAIANSNRLVFHGPEDYGTPYVDYPHATMAILVDLISAQTVPSSVHCSSYLEGTLINMHIPRSGKEGCFAVHV